MIASRVFPLRRGVALVLMVGLTACSGGGGSATPATVATVAATATPTAPTVATAYTCPASATSANSIGRSATGLAEATRRAAARPARNVAAKTGLLAVTYDGASASRSSASIATHETQLGGSLIRSYAFNATSVVTHLLAVPAGQLATTAATLRTQTGVRSVAAAGGRRHRTAVTQPYFPNDPYFNGFTAQQNLTAGHVAASTFHVGPYEETASVPGQWDMHAIGLEHAFGYSQANNGSGITNAAALGSSAIKIAIIDTGVDPNHPELASKIAYQRCFITNPNNSQSTGPFSTDPDGHGTDVAGIAAAATGNTFGVSGAGGNAVIYAYRVFPTPDDNCANDNTTDNQCGVDTADIASAIQDAIAQHVNVISMSLGGDVCSAGGVDSDPLEGAAVAEAIANKIVVVAAAGNDGSSPLEAPACDSGVIAAGASALADGQTNGSNTSSGSTATPVEYVASYSDFGSPSAAVRSTSAWGIVAPGGDPVGAGDGDDLHWIENLWTSTPFDTKFSGECTDDYPNGGLTAAPVDCRTLIAGTSMATPHVAGAAALILAVNPSYQSPAAMKQLLCSTADDISDPHEGCGRLNVYRALATALGDPAPP